MEKSFPEKEGGKSKIGPEWMENSRPTYSEIDVGLSEAPPVDLGGGGAQALYPCTTALSAVAGGGYTCTPSYSIEQHQLICCVGT